MVAISERSFEETIEAILLQGGPDDPSGVIGEVRYPSGSYAEFVPGGYRRRRPEEYDRTLCLIPRDVLDFIYATQPKEWERLKTQHGAEIKDRFLKRLSSEIEKRGVLDVLRKGIKDSGCRFQLAYFRPSSGLNEAFERMYQANLFSVIRQLRYSEKNEKSLDLVLFLNGIPVLTAELKNPLTGQNVEDAIQQYRFDRDPKEPLLGFRRCLAHLAGDQALVAAVQTNTPENARLAFDYVANDRLQDMVDANFRFYKRITDDKDFGRFFLDWLFDRFRKSIGRDETANGEGGDQRPK